MVRENTITIILCRDGSRRKDKQMGKYENDVEDLNELEDRYGVTIKGRQPRKRAPKMKKERKDQKNVPEWKKNRKKLQKI